MNVYQVLFPATDQCWLREHRCVAGGCSSAAAYVIDAHACSKEVRTEQTRMQPPATNATTVASTFCGVKACMVAFEPGFAGTVFGARGWWGGPLLLAGVLKTGVPANTARATPVSLDPIRV